MQKKLLSLIWVAKLEKNNEYKVPVVRSLKDNKWFKLQNK